MNGDSLPGQPSTPFFRNSLDLLLRRILGCLAPIDAARASPRQFGSRWAQAHRSTVRDLEVPVRECLRAIADLGDHAQAAATTDIVLTILSQEQQLVDQAASCGGEGELSDGVGGLGGRPLIVKHGLGILAALASRVTSAALLKRLDGAVLPLLIAAYGSEDADVRRHAVNCLVALDGALPDLFQDHLARAPGVTKALQAITTIYINQQRRNGE